MSFRYLDHATFRGGAISNRASSKLSIVGRVAEGSERGPHPLLRNKPRYQFLDHTLASLFALQRRLRGLRSVVAIMRILCVP